MASILSIAVLLHCLASEAQSGTACSTKRWCKYSVESCLDESLASARWSTASLHGCLAKAGSSTDRVGPDDPVAQWNRQTGVCSLFPYQRVCGFMKASGIATAIGGDSCSVLRATMLASCSVTLSPRLLGVWLAGGGSRFGNLVCQSGNANTSFVGVNLIWTDEGASFNGASSYAMLNDSRFSDSNTTSGFTWLMRLKREPRVQPFMEVTPCYDTGIYGRHFWEYSNVNQLYYNKVGWDSDATNFAMYSSQNVLPAASNVWVNIGISIGSSEAQSATFYNQGFVNHTKDVNINHRSSCYFLVIGGRIHKDFVYLKGVVRAVAIANSSMSEQEIRNFFSALP